MNHSLYSADRATHLKIIIVALVAGTMVAGVGIAARMDSGAGSATASVKADKPVLKAGKPVIYTHSETTAVR
jgi:flagellar basal body-associated protein FliL